MTYSTFKTRCPHEGCGHEADDSAGGWGVFGKEVTVCSACGKPFATLANSYNWQDTESDNPPSDPDGPENPTAELTPQLQAIADALLAEKAARQSSPPLPQALAGEQLYALRGGRHVPVAT